MASTEEHSFLKPPANSGEINLEITIKIVLAAVV